MRISHCEETQRIVRKISIKIFNNVSQKTNRGGKA